MDKGHARVIIIGAGMAGLSAASHLYRAGFNDVIILEATDRIGGRIHTVQFGDSPYPIELGANWIHGCSKENSVFDVAESGGFLTPYRNLNRQSSMYLKEDGTEVDRNIVAKAWAIFRKVYLDAYRNEKTNLEAYMLPTVEKILSSTDPEIRHDMGCVFQSMINYVRLHEGNELYNVAFKDIVPDVGGGDMHIPGGYKQVLDYIRRNIPGSAILFNTEVVTIKWNSNERGTVQLTTRDGRAFEANHVIITCAIGYLKAYKESLFDPVLPTPKNDAISSIGYGIINKVFMEFETPLMNHIHHGIVFAWENAHEKIDSSNWFKRFYAVDTVFTNPRLVTAWISGDGAIFMEDMKDQEVVQTLMKLIRKFMNDDTIPDPINYLITRWHKNPYSLGSYSHPASTTRNDYGDIAEPVKNQNGAPVLFFAGEGTQLAYFGCTHAARDSGIREAERIIKYCGTGGQTAVSKL